MGDELGCIKLVAHALNSCSAWSCCFLFTSGHHEVTRSRCRKIPVTDRAYRPLRISQTGATSVTFGPYRQCGEIAEGLLREAMASFLTMTSPADQRQHEFLGFVGPEHDAGQAQADEPVEASQWCGLKGPVEKADVHHGDL